MDAHVDDGGGGAPFCPTALDRQFFDLIHHAQSVVDHVCGGLKSETFSVKLGVVETMVSMRCLKSPSEEVEVAW